VHADLDALITALYVRVDDVLPKRRGPGHPPRITNAELITLAVAQTPGHGSTGRGSIRSDRGRSPRAHMALCRPYEAAAAIEGAAPFATPTAASSQASLWRRSDWTPTTFHVASTPRSYASAASRELPTPSCSRRPGPAGLPVPEGEPLRQGLYGGVLRGGERSGAQLTSPGRRWSARDAVLGACDSHPGLKEVQADRGSRFADECRARGDPQAGERGLRVAPTERDPQRAGRPPVDAPVSRAPRTAGRAGRS
jgi:hypothetical protein